jgi:hypothetical protein
MVTGVKISLYRASPTTVALSNLVVFVDYQSKDCIHGQQVRNSGFGYTCEAEVTDGQGKSNH